MKNYCIENVGSKYSMTACDAEYLYDLLCGFASEEEALDAKIWTEDAEIGDVYRGSCYSIKIVEEVL